MKQPQSPFHHWACYFVMASCFVGGVLCFIGAVKTESEKIAILDGFSAFVLIIVGIVLFILGGDDQ